MLSCAVVLLLPAPALAATAPATAAGTATSGPAVRTAPRAVAPPGPASADGGWEERLSQRLAGTVAGDRPHGTRDGRGGALPLPPLFGHHGHHDGPAGPAARAAGQTRTHGGTATERWGPHGPHGHHGHGPGRTDHSGRHLHPHTGPDATVAAPGAATDDAEPGGTVPRSAGPGEGTGRQDSARTGAPGGAREGDRAGAREHPPEAEQGPSAPPAPGEPWSPAPVAPEDAVAGGADPGRPQAGPPRQSSAADPADDTTDADGPPATAAAPAGPILPVLPLGAGLTCLGLGLAFLALRMRRG